MKKHLFIPVACTLMLCACSSGQSSAPSMISGTLEYSFPKASSSISSSLSGDNSAAASSVASAASSVPSTASSVASAASSVASAASSAVPSSSASRPVSGTAFQPDPNDDWAAILVNKISLLPDGYKPELGNLNSSRKFDARMLPYMQSMIAAAKKDGIILNVISSYRSPERQVELYNAKVSEYVKKGYSKSDAEAEAAKVVAPPGTSEHCTGLAADIVSTDWYDHHSSLTEAFDQTPEYRWLEAHAAEYGFILRYPKGKESITMIDYEPWHYRYVGTTAAAYIWENNLCLEEYVAEFFAN